MGKIAILVIHELRLLMKDRQALGLLFLMPLTFIIFLTLALQDVYMAKVGKKVQLEVVAATQCEKKDSVCSRLVTELRRQQYDIEVSPEAKLKRQLTVIFPTDIEKTIDLIKKGQALQPNNKLQLIFDPTLDQSLRALIESNLMLALQSVMIDQVHKQIEEAQKNLPKGFKKIESVADVSHTAGLVEQKAANGLTLPNPIQQTVPAWSLFGMFFIVIPLANSMIRDRRLGLFKRLLSFPVKRGQLILGKVLPFLIINIFQFVLMFAVGVFVLPLMTSLHLVLDFSYWHILLVTVACAFAATSYGLMIACIAKTTEQASAFGALSVVILAIVGGVMIPRFVMPDFMQQISRGSPMHWGLEAYLDILVRKAAFSVTVEKILVLVAFGIVCLTIARFRFRWSEAE